jgi:hypothetical protein
MKRILLFFFLIYSFNAIYAQRTPVVGIMEFESGGGVTSAEMANVSEQVISELNSWETLNIVRGSEGAAYVVSVVVSRQGNLVVLEAKTTDTGTKKVLNESKETAANFREINIISFCGKITEKVPLPNYLLGKWQAVLNMPDGPVICIMEFKSDRTVTVERYDTWEHKQNNALRYEGYGSGTYSYAGYMNRQITVNSRQIRIDAIISVNLKLEETLPEQTAVNQVGLILVFNGDRSTFDIINGIFPCGNNYDGQSVYPSTVLGFSGFTKVR